MHIHSMPFFQSMKSQQKVLISGVVFHVEERCRKKLMQHIELIQSDHVSMTDERLAEILLAQLRDQGTDVICAQMVEQVIERLKKTRKPD